MSEVILEGKCIYANVPPRAPQKAYEGEDMAYSIQVQCSEEKFKELKKAGIPSLTQLKEFDGETYIKLKATKIKHMSDGRVLEFNDIPVVSENGTPITDSIANGSTVRVLATLDDIKGRAGKKVLRLKGVVVTNLIVWEGGKAGSKVLSSLGVTKGSDDLGDIFA